MSWLEGKAPFVQPCCEGAHLASVALRPGCGAGPMTEPSAFWPSCFEADVLELGRHLLRQHLHRTAGPTVPDPATPEAGSVFS